MDLVLPSNDDAERAVLGGLLVNPDTWPEVADVVAPHDFHREQHREVYSAMERLTHRGEPLDILTVTSELGENADPLFVSQLMDGIPRLMNVPWYARLVRRSSKQRQAVVAAHRFADEVAGSDDPARLLDSMAAGLAVVLHEDTATAPSVQEVLSGYLDDLEARVTGSQKLDWLGTGLTALDDLIGGWCPGEMVIIAARPSIGKTSFALSTARHRAEQGGVLVFSSEMSRRSVGERLLAMEARIDLQELRLACPEQQLSDRDWNKLTDAFSRLRGLDLAIDDRAGINARYIRAVVRQHQLERSKASKPPLRDVVIDYLQLLQGPGSGLREIVTQLAKELKTLAREERVAVLLLSQLRRPEGKVIPPPPPHLHELKESGAIEENADVVVMLDRPEFYLETAGQEIGEHASVAWAHVAKNRQGPVGRVKLGFRKSSTLFADVWWTGSERRIAGSGHLPPELQP